MLQIATGKLFTKPVGRENRLRGVLYTNAVFTSERVETAAGDLLTLSTTSVRPYALIYELIECMEDNEVTAGVLFSSGIEAYLQDCSVLVSFALNCICTVDVDLARRLASNQVGLSTRQTTQRFVSRFFDTDVPCRAEEISFLKSFTSKLIGLPRKTFLGVMRALRAYINGMHRVSDDLDLAYTLLVVSVESLAQDFDDHESDWESVSEHKRQTIDKALSVVEPDAAGNIRAAILEFEHVALARRFREFVAKHTPPSYFRELSSDSEILRLGRSDLDGVLKVAYQSRSKYIHQVHQLPDAVLLGNGYGEVVLDGRVMHLTLQGLSRLMRNTIVEFVMSQPTVEHEPYNYHLERCGIVQLRMAPEYWVGRSEGDITKAGRDKLEGFLQQLGSIYLREANASLTSLKSVLEISSEFIPSLDKRLRLPYLALHFLFNGVVKKEDSVKLTSAIRDLIDSELAQPGSESLVVYAVKCVVVPWSLIKHKKALEDYLRRRSTKNGLRFPRLFEAAMCLELAERFRVFGDMDECREIIALAVENYPGHSGLLELEKSLKPSAPICWMDIMLPSLDAT
ncbi:MAG: hypothetical protein RBR45_03820 [Pseudomonas sp.]|nr:hypothetical protein [Pseudomonas sp.]